MLSLFNFKCINLLYCNKTNILLLLVFINVLAVMLFNQKEKGNERHRMTTDVKFCVICCC